MFPSRRQWQTNSASYRLTCARLCRPISAQGGFCHVADSKWSESTGWFCPAAANCRRAAAAQRAHALILEQSGSRRGRWSSRLGWTLFILALLYIVFTWGNYSKYMQSNPHIEEKYVSHSKTASDKLAIIKINGLIASEDGFAKWQIDQVRDDPNVKAVVVRIDSPGGTINASNYLYHRLVELKNEKKIPLVVSMGGLAASGGYYVSMAVGDTPDTIYAEPTTWTGSIGVVIPHYDISELLTKWDITDDSIVSNPLKLLGSPTRKVTPELAKQEHDILQDLVDQSFADFKDIVKSGRPAFQKDPAKLDKLATGQVFTAKQAKDDGLVDQIGYLDDAVNAAIKLNKLEPENVRVVKYAAPKGLLGEVLLGSSALSDLAALSRGPRLDISALLDLTAPRVLPLHMVAVDRSARWIVNAKGDVLAIGRLYFQYEQAQRNKRMQLPPEPEDKPRIARARRRRSRSAVCYTHGRTDREDAGNLRRICSSQRHANSGLGN